MQIPATFFPFWYSGRIYFFEKNILNSIYIKLFLSDLPYQVETSSERREPSKLGSTDNRDRPWSWKKLCWLLFDWRPIVFWKGSRWEHCSNENHFQESFVHWSDKHLPPFSPSNHPQLHHRLLQAAKVFQHRHHCKSVRYVDHHHLAYQRPQQAAHHLLHQVDWVLADLCSVSSVQSGSPHHCRPVDDGGGRKIWKEGVLKAGMLEGWWKDSWGLISLELVHTGWVTQPKRTQRTLT